MTFFVRNTVSADFFWLVRKLHTLESLQQTFASRGASSANTSIPYLPVPESFLNNGFDSLINALKPKYSFDHVNTYRHLTLIPGVLRVVSPSSGRPHTLRMTAYGTVAINSLTMGRSLGGLHFDPKSLHRGTMILS